MKINSNEKNFSNYQLHSIFYTFFIFILKIDTFRTFSRLWDPRTLRENCIRKTKRITVKLTRDQKISNSESYDDVNIMAIVGSLSFKNIKELGSDRNIVIKNYKKYNLFKNTCGRMHKCSACQWYIVRTTLYIYFM